ncbi:MAG: type I DNA topoisomerase, partial [Candidatus Paceibacterota bacterium]
MQLILVESPTKARTFNKYLKGDKYRVEATMGHMRDLPKSKLGIDPKSRYKPEYVEVEEKKEAIEKIEKLAKKSKSIILATDADREGEAISYHVAYLLGYVEEKWPKATLIDGKKLKRIVFHEITKSAIEKALLTPQELNLDLVDSQQARRILDRIVGYKVSPLLWKKMGKRWLSAGRVQTVALRFIVEREKEIEKFKRQAYYKVFGNFKVSSHEIEAKLVSKEGKTYEAKQKLELFDGDYTYTKTTITALNSKVIKEDLSTDSYTVHDVKSSTSKRTPPPPYTTSTLQQDASRRLGYSSKYTMSLAQKLYERGFITYHRTDSVSMSGGFVSSTRKFIKDTYTENYLSEETRRYKTKSKLAQEAHEAIRPTDVRRDIVKKKGLRGAHLKLYKLIFNRAVATQMAPAEILTIKIQILSRKKYLFETSFQSITFNGYLRLYGKKSEKSNHAKPGIGDTAKLIDLNFEEAETLPPPRYNEASLIKTLEDKGIGRPSTYAPTISTIQTRNYVEKNEGRFNPSVLGTAVSDYLVSAFPKLFAIDYT